MFNFMLDLFFLSMFCRNPGTLRSDLWSSYRWTCL